MTIRVEFYGIARQRAGQSAIDLDAPAAGMPLTDLLRELDRRLSDFGREFVIDGRLQESLAVNLNGDRFITDPQSLIRNGEIVLIFSADAGG